MPDIHTIRLKHPWQCEPRENGCCWIRPFNWPAGLLPREVAWLVVEPCPEEAVVLLSGKPLVAGAPGRFDISAVLREFNQITIQLPETPPSDQTECPLEVRLEIVEA